VDELCQNQPQTEWDASSNCKPSAANATKRDKNRQRRRHVIHVILSPIAYYQSIFTFNDVTETHRFRSDYAFPSPGAEGFMSNNTMLFAMYRMGFHGRDTVHGFRAVASTLLNEMGFHPDWIERQLAHDERNKVRADYNHAQYLPERRRMMQQWADYLDNLAVGWSLVNSGDRANFLLLRPIDILPIVPKEI
jgi:integrase